jgi:tetratricopeptide (TPR) repeat protein
MESFWVANNPREGIRWFQAFFEHPDAKAVTADLRARALHACGSATDIAGDDETAERSYEESLALFEQLGDVRGRAELLHRLGIQALRRGDPERARELVVESRELFESQEDAWVRMWGQMQTTGTLGAVARDLGDDAHALELIAKSAALAGNGDMPWWQAGMLAEHAALLLRGGNLEEAELTARESLTIAEQLHDRGGRVFGVGLLAVVAAERGERERAGRLWGAVEDENVGAPLGGWLRHRESCEERIREAAGPEFERGRAEGRASTLDEAIALALTPVAVRPE